MGSNAGPPSAINCASRHETLIRTPDDETETRLPHPPPSEQGRHADGDARV